MTWITPVLLIFGAFFALAMVNPINAAPPNVCETFCDQDGDSWIRDHNKCTACEGLGTDCDDNAYSEDNDCNGGGSEGDYIQHFKSIRVIWGNDVVNVADLLGLPYETNPDGNQTMRLCGPRVGEEPDPIIPVHPMVDIKNVCHGNAEFLYGREYWNTVYLDFSALPLEPSGRNLALCERLVGETEDYPYFPMEIVPKAEEDCESPPCVEDDPANVGRLSMYHFVLDESNTEPCTWDSNEDNSCKVRIFTQGYFYNECSGPKCGRRIGMEAYGRVEHFGEEGDYPIEINPFTKDQEIVLEELNVFFMGLGTNRKEADCYLNNVKEGGGYHYENLVFRTCVDANENGVCDSDPSEP